MPFLRALLFMGAMVSSSAQATIAVPQPLPPTTLPAVAPISASGVTPPTTPVLPATVTPSGVPVAPNLSTPVPVPQAPPIAIPGAAPLAMISPAVGPVNNGVVNNTASLEDDDDDDDEDEDEEDEDEDEDEENTQNSRRGKSASCPCPVGGKDRSFITALRKNAMALEPVTRASRRFNDDWPDDNRSAAAMVSEQETTNNMGAGASGFFDTLLGVAATKLEEKLSEAEDDEDEDEII